MDCKPDSCRPSLPQFPDGIIQAQTTLSRAAMAAIEEYGWIAGFSLECLLCAAWSHLFGAFAQAESVDVVTASGNGEPFRLTVSKIPASFNGTVRQWLASVAESLQERSPIENRNVWSHPPCRRGQAGAIASVESVVTIGDLPDIQACSRQLRSPLFVHLSKTPELLLSVAGSAETFTIETLDMLA